MKNKLKKVKIVIYFLARDQEISRFLYSLKPNSKSIKIAVSILTKGYGLSFIFLAALLTSRNVVLTIISFLGIIIFTTIFIEVLFKKVIKRRRPGFSTNQYHTYSFPSTHSSTIAIGTGHILVNNSMYNLSVPIVFALLTWGFFVTISRIVYGYHYLLDVVVGILLGLALSLFFLLFNS